MARKNRVSVYDGIYHVTTRIANRAMLLKPEAVKDRIREWIYSVAAFSGIEVWAWCIMDNHLHLLLHVPPVPKRYWLDPQVEPAAYAFGMRPPECREPLWSPQGDCPCGEVAAGLPGAKAKGSTDMARKNRVSVYDGTYHVTARIAHRAMLLAEDEVKDKIMEWIVSVAEFSGVEVWSFAVMDNHLHLLVHVPPVPRRLWTDPNDEPCAYAFGMRPPECREPLWSPDGDCPPPPRPALGFMLDDDEMVGRLACLYGPERAAAIGKAWESARAHGGGASVDREKERYCRRMYNLSQFVKTLKERVSMWYNATYGHAGALWQGRFYSGVVEKKAAVKAVVSAYVGYNPVKAGRVAAPADWKWSSYARAVAGADGTGAYCRGMYERMLGRPWDEVRRTLEAVFADGLPDSVSPEDLREWYDDYDARAGSNARAGGVYRASQAVRATLKAFSGAYIGSSMDFFRRVTSALPEKFPRAGSLSVRRCLAFRWELPASAPLTDAA